MSIQSLIMRAVNYPDVEGVNYEKGPRVVVTGVGGAGCNAVTRMKKLGLQVPTIAVNTDFKHLQIVEADKKILLKKLTGGQGTGGSVDLGERAALLAANELRRIFENEDIVFITTGLGGGTGTGAAPVIARIARECGALVITLVTLPFKIEKARFSRAKEGLSKIMESSNTVIVIENDKLMEIVPHLPLDKAFMVMDQLMSYTIMSFVDMITKPSLINVDISDLRTVMEDGMLSTILISEGDVREPRDVVIEALNRPFVIDMDYSSASGAVIHVTVGEDAPLSTMYTAVDTISSFLKSNARIILGTRVAPEFENRIRILVILTGIKIPMLGEVYAQEEERETKRLDVYDLK